MHKDVLCIADSLLRSPEIVISNYGSVIYEQAFINLDNYCQQVGSLTLREERWEARNNIHVVRLIAHVSRKVVPDY